MGHETHVTKVKRTVKTPFVAPRIPSKSATGIAARLLALGALTAFGTHSVGCETVPVVRNCDPNNSPPCPGLNDPAGRIEGTLVYQGPPPPESPTQAGVASGRVVLLLFDYDNPPPPQGSATTAVSFQTISAAQLFASATALPDGTVRATIQFSFPGISRGGLYQLRAFYSRPEQIANPSDPAGGTVGSGFHPLFNVRNLPVRGDVGGGAIVDSSAAVPVFARIPVGIEDGTDDRGRPRYRMPEEGYVARNVTVFLGRQFPLERPQFTVVTEGGMRMGPAPTPVTLLPPFPSERTRVSAVPPVTEPLADAAGNPVGNVELDDSGIPKPGPALLEFARQFGLSPTGSPVMDIPRNVIVRDTTGGMDLPSFNIAPSMPAEDCAVAALAGVRCAQDPFREIGFVEQAADINENGVIDLTPASLFADAHPTLLTSSPLAAPTMGRLPWIYPLVIITKLHEPTALERGLLLQGQNGRLTAEQYGRLRQALNRPEALDTRDPADPRYPVLLFGSVVPGGSAAGFLTNPWTRPASPGMPAFTLVEPFPRVVIVPIGVEVRGPSRANDWVPLLSPVPPETAAALERSLAGFREVRCAPYDAAGGPEQASGLPPGRYAINLIGPGGQSWSLPNDLNAFLAPSGATLPAQGCANGVCGARSQSFFLRLRGLETPPAGVRCPMVTPR